MLCEKKQLTLNSTVSTLLLKRELAPSAVNHPSTEEFASSEDVTPKRISFPEVGSSLTGNPVPGNWHVNLLSFFTF